MKINKILLSYFEDFSFYAEKPSGTFGGGHGQSVIFRSAILFKDAYRLLSDRASLVEILSQSHFSRPPLCHLTMPDSALIPLAASLPRDNQRADTATWKLCITSKSLAAWIMYARSATIVYKINLRKPATKRRWNAAK